MLDLPRDVRDGHRDLTPMEWQAIRRHPDLSQRRMQAWGIVSPQAQRAVRHHHERWDGAGYPGHLVGLAIPVEARYVAIADAYSALTVAKRGMPRLSRGDALREMARSEGQFDPGLTASPPRYDCGAPTSTSARISSARTSACVPRSPPSRFSTTE